MDSGSIARPQGRAEGLAGGPRAAHPPSSSEEVLAARNRTACWLEQRQDETGFWCGELEGDTILESETILLLGWLRRERSDVARKAAQYLLTKQQPGGGWALYPGGDLDVSASVKAYLALKLAGYQASDPAMRAACQAIRAHGGADRVNSFTRFYLAMLGQISYEHCPAVPPEMILLPDWAPVNIYRISAWSRTILVPLSVVWAYRPQRPLPAACGISELCLQRPDKWPPLRCPGQSPTGRLISWDRFFRCLDAGLKWNERWGVRPWRRRALAAAEEWMIEHLEDSDGLGAIFPPIVWSLVALRCLGYSAESRPVEECQRQLEGLMIDEAGTVRIQPCKSPVWDTALSLRALVAAAPHAENAIQRGCRWLLEREVRKAGDWSRNTAVQPSGWFFEHRNAFYPDLDDTAMVLMALWESLEAQPPQPQAGRTGSEPDEPGWPLEIASACQRGLEWVLAMQNRDGGWGAFDRENNRQFLCHVPFADHNAMIDPSTPDITARILEALARFGLGTGDEVVQRAVAYLRSTQEPDGSWFGRWGVNYLYGTWQALTGQAAVGIGPDDPTVQRGIAWLLAHQQPGGGWGESPASYAEQAYRGTGPVTPSQTAWAVLALTATGQANLPAVQRGVRYLLDTQRPDGSWIEPEFTGTGFPLVFYLRYHMYPIYFPLLALARWHEAHAREASDDRSTCCAERADVRLAGGRPCQQK